MNPAIVGINFVEFIVDFKIIPCLYFLFVCVGCFGLCVQDDVAVLSLFIQQIILLHIILKNYRATPMHSINQLNSSQRLIWLWI